MKILQKLGLILCMATAFAVDPWDDINFLESSLTTSKLRDHHESYNDSHAALTLGEFIPLYVKLHTLKLEEITEAELSSLFTGLPSVATLRRLSLKNVAHFTDTTPIGTIPQLTWVTLSNSGVTSLNGLENIESLAILEVEDCTELVDFSALALLKEHMVQLVLTGTNFTDENLLDKYHSLKILYLSRTPLKKLPHESTLNNVKEIHINQMPALIDIEPLRFNESVEKLVFRDPQLEVDPYFYYVIGTMRELTNLDLEGHTNAHPGDIYKAIKGSRTKILKLDLESVPGVPFSVLFDKNIEEIEIGPFETIPVERQKESIDDFLGAPSFKSLIIHRIGEDLLYDGNWSKLGLNLEHLRLENKIDLRTLPALPKLIDLHISEGQAFGGEGFSTVAPTLEELRCKLAPLKEFVAAGKSTAEFVSLKKLRVFCSRGEASLSLLDDMPALETLSVHCDVFNNHPRSFWESIQALVDKGVTIDSKTQKELDKL